MSCCFVSAKAYCFLMYWYVWIITKTVTPSISGITVLEISIEIVAIYKGRLFSLIKKSRIFNINTPFSI
jgi:hypothetical protein